jgi:hypothetical protein
MEEDNWKKVGKCEMYSKKIEEKLQILSYVNFYLWIKYAVHKLLKGCVNMAMNW